MVALIREVPTGLVIDLNDLDLFGVALFEEWHGHCRGVNRNRFACEVATCKGVNAPVYLQIRNGARLACHFDGGIVHRATPVAESDEHKRGAEYLARAGADHGLIVDLNKALPGRTSRRRPDAAIKGGKIAVAAEVQLSGISVKTVVDRTRDHAAEGFQSMWLYSGPPAEWATKAPALGTNALGWDRVEPAGSWRIARGTGRIRMYRCEMQHMHRFRITYGQRVARCPDGNSRPCGREHPAFDAEQIFADRDPFNERGANRRVVVNAGRSLGGAYGAAGGLSIDAAVGLIPAGKIVAVRLRRQHVWVPEGDGRLWGEAIAAAESRARPAAPERSWRRAADCDRPHQPAKPSIPVLRRGALPLPNRPSGTCMVCGGAARLFAAGWRCGEHQPKPGPWWVD